MRLNLPLFDMVVIGIDSRVTFKVDCKGRVARIITKRTILPIERFIDRTRSPRGPYCRGSILPKGEQ